MSTLRQHEAGTSGQIGWRPSPPLALLVAFLFWLAQFQQAFAGIDNDARAVGTYNGGVVASAVSTRSVPVVPLTHDVSIQKTGTLNDDDGTPGISAGDTIDYVITLSNTGTGPVTGIALADTVQQGSSSTTLTPTLVASSDNGSDNILSAGEAWTYNVSYTLTAANVSDGSPLTNLVTVSSNEAPDRSDNDVQYLGGGGWLSVKKTVASATEILPSVVEIEYRLRLENTGTVTLTNLALEDDLLAAVSAPATLLGAGSVTAFSGFSGSGGLNGAYNGIGNNQVFAGDVQLVAGAIGEVRIRVRVDRKARSLDLNNVARVTATELPGTNLSDDPTQTPSNTNDQNPTEYDRPDGDGDGSPDANESSATDRDGDGITDAQDYDPTGYFYCQADGRILTGGLISVQNVGTSGIQTGIGSSNDITILQDGSNGFYQFYVTAPGRYRLLSTLPPSGVASTSRFSAGRLDATSLLPSNPGVLGSGELGSTGVLGDFTAGANPFYTEFDIEVGDPSIFNNNIPLERCGTPSFAVAKAVSSGPTVNADGSSSVAYAIAMENDGTEAIANVSLEDDLFSVFGSNYTIDGLSLGLSPAGFTAVANPFYNGNGNSALLTTGGTLQPGERVELTLQVTLSGSPGSYTNTVTGTGENWYSAVPLGARTAQAAISLEPASAQSGIVATKTTFVDAVPLGGVVPYTITFHNRSNHPATNAELVDFLPPGFSYVEGSARLNGKKVEPSRRSARELVWSGQTLAAGARTVLTLSLAAGAAAPGTEFVNTAFMRDPLTGRIISNQAKARVRLEVESQFHCSHVIGRVFDDLDKDGYYDEGEPGLGGVRIVSVNGLLITTDEFGRYHVACDAIPADRIGSNYILKLDEKTLPTGFTVTSENPRVVRMTRGKLVKINFSAANLQAVSLELSDASFQRGTRKLVTNAIRDIARLLPVLDQDRSVLTIRYRARGKGTRLQRARLNAVATLLTNAWNAKQRQHPLEVDAKLVRVSVNF